MSQWKKAWRLLPLLAVMMLVLTGCGQDPFLSALTPRGPVAEQQFYLIKLSIYIMMGVFAVVMVIYVYVLVRFRHRPGQTGIPEQIEGSHKLEIIWTTIPLILLTILAIPTVKITFDLAEKFPTDDALQVKVIAHQFWWEYEYPDLGISAAQDLYIPTGEKVQFQLTSEDVIHSFWAPALGGKTDTNPGMVNAMWLQADDPGVYKGKCAELCGDSHTLMDFKIVAMDRPEFDAWVEKMKEPHVSSSDVAEGEQIFADSCISCHAIDATQGLDIPDFAPNLRNFGDRVVLANYFNMDDETIAEWIKNPEKMKPGNLMPGFADELDDQQLASLVDYLNTLSVK
ncbi:cytochrome c oxidase subunit II [Ammoniphilus oxalaticus]|uniref:Cytochrome c oxidase subunit 2 n=1 Tax=Ammoniphilus oxalaticus TaxID=66863 RepID=A0A419SF82_9BACL|nr:cytochrome c oxidase subunit II [Ammoniphilus oxalaticus]RKD21790.1 cytochrome c oxidase subunit II [Ammoniphilus oxalaticus]